MKPGDILSVDEIAAHTADVLRSPERVNHPRHYGGDTTYEAIKVIEAWGLDFPLGNAVKYICRAGKKDPASELEDLRKAAWYLNRRIEQLDTPAIDPISRDPIQRIVEIIAKARTRGRNITSAELAEIRLIAEEIATGIELPAQRPHEYVSGRNGCAICGMGIGAYMHNDEAIRNYAQRHMNGQ